MVQIRKAFPADANRLASLGKETYIESHGKYFKKRQNLMKYCRSYYAPKIMSDSLKNPDHAYFVATFEEEAIGYVKLELDMPSEFVTGTKLCHLHKIYVSGSRLKMRVGSDLLQTALQYARDNQCDQIWLSVYHENIQAINFYQRNDFSVRGHYWASVGDEDFKILVFAKPLI